MTKYMSNSILYPVLFFIWTQLTQFQRYGTFLITSPPKIVYNIDILKICDIGGHYHPLYNAVLKVSLVCQFRAIPQGQEYNFGGQLAYNFFPKEVCHAMVVQPFWFGWNKSIATQFKWSISEYSINSNCVVLHDYA